MNIWPRWQLPASLIYKYSLNGIHYVFPSFRYKIHSPNPSLELLTMKIIPSLTSICKAQDNLYLLSLHRALQRRERKGRRFKSSFHVRTIPDLNFLANSSLHMGNRTFPPKFILVISALFPSLLSCYTSWPYSEVNFFRFPYQEVSYQQLFATKIFSNHYCYCYF